MYLRLFAVLFSLGSIASLSAMNLPYIRPPHISPTDSLDERENHEEKRDVKRMKFTTETETEPVQSEPILLQDAMHQSNHTQPMVTRAPQRIVKSIGFKLPSLMQSAELTNAAIEKEDELHPNQIPKQVSYRNQDNAIDDYTEPKPIIDFSKDWISSALNNHQPIALRSRATILLQEKKMCEWEIWKQGFAARLNHDIDHNNANNNFRPINENETD